MQDSGYAQEVGQGPGTGFTVNVPWTSEGMGDADYLAAFDLILEPIIAQFDPQVGRCYMTSLLPAPSQLLPIRRCVATCLSR
jgi:hypothetical protein